MMPPEGGGGGVRQGGIDLLLLYRDTRQVLFDRDVACFQTKAMFINTTRKRQDTRSFNKIKDCLIGPLELALDGEKL